MENTQWDELEEVGKSFNSLVRAIDKLDPEFWANLHLWKEKALKEMSQLIPIECYDLVDEYRMEE